MLRDFSPRLYQQTILGTAAQNNTLVVLPTGLGKTALAFLLAAQRLSLYPQSKVLILSPTKPLCEQHLETFRKHLEIPPEKMALFTGNVTPETRAELWKAAQIVVSTPQGLENDVINQRVKLEEVSLLVFDEAHHATGDYSYVWLAQQYEQSAPYPRILALTASPGSDVEKIREIVQNLRIEKIELRTDRDPDVQPYIQPLHIHWVKVVLPDEFKKIKVQLEECRNRKLAEAQKYGYGHGFQVTKTELLAIQRELQQKIASGQRDFETLRTISLMAEAIKVEHALELLESQGLAQLQAYFSKIWEAAKSSKVRAVKNLLLDQNFKSAMFLTGQLVRQNVQHPKLPQLLALVQQELAAHPAAKIIVFTQFRHSAGQIVSLLSEQGISSSIFVGQAKKEGIGFSQKQQKEVLDRFRKGEFNLLIATSVAEEGLDIPSVDKVIFYEPVPSAIRSIQRRGRTARQEKGEVTVLITQGTRDEGYRWSSYHKEKQMYRNLEALKRNIHILQPENVAGTTAGTITGITAVTPAMVPLQKFISEQQVVAVLADHREKDNKIVKELVNLGVSVRTGQLQSADYLLSGRVAVELKKVPDFVASIIDGRLLEQVRDLKRNFERAVLVIEGEEDLYAVRKVHANAIRGMLASIVLDFGVPVLYTKNPQDTAGLLAVMAKREQEHERDFSYHERKPYSLREQQEFLVSSLPGIGVQTARKLLEKFGSVKLLVNATREELLAIEGVGEKTAERLLKLWEESYAKE